MLEQLRTSYHCIDLTHSLNPHVPTWTGECGFRSKTLLDYPEGSRVLTYHCIGSAGTHIDAPSHFIPQGKNIDEIALDALCTELCVIDMTAPCAPTSQITLKDIENFEKKFGPIPSGSIVIGRTGWERHWTSPKIYRGTGDLPQSPSFEAAVGSLFLERKIAGLGIDTLSPDPFGSDYPLHHALLGNNLFIIENLAHLDALPPKGSYLFALPLKIDQGTESPARVIAFVPKALKSSRS